MALTDSDLTARLSATFGAAGLDGFVHAVDLASGREVDYRKDALCHAASVGKVPVLVTLMRAVAAGEQDLREPVRIAAGDRTPGPTGLSVMTGAAELSLRDIAQLMIGVSDNHATDLLLGRLGPARVTGTMRALGLSRTTLETTIAEMYRRAAERAAGTSDLARLGELWRSDPDLDPPTAPWRATPAEITRLLGLIWRDECAPPHLCAEMRSILRTCATSNGLAGGFSLEVQQRLAHKTGTTVGVRNEAGVIEYPGGALYGVAVFTRGDPAAWRLQDPAASLALGAAARLAVDHLRGEVGTLGGAGR